MRGRTALIRLLILATLAWLGLTDLLRAQSMNTGMPGSANGLGPLALPSGQLMGASAPAKAVNPGISINDSYVSIMDGAAPRNMFMVHVDMGYGNRQPSRGEYFLAKGGVPNSTGFSLIETRVDYQELTTHAEYALAPWFSVFVEAPYRWINPEVNSNDSGPGDMKYGLKLCTWSSDSVIATVLLRLYQPSARHSDLGTGHWSIEPGLLAAYRYNPNILFEGEVRYWVPLGGSDFAGDLIRYGAGVSFGRRNPGGIWYMPVVEGVGWTMLSGKTISASSPEQFLIQDARGQTIVNGYLGLRFGYGPSTDFYVGYGHSFTGHFWERDFIRLEARFVY